MRPEDQFERALKACLNHIEGAQTVGCRAESIEAVEQGIKAAGLDPTVSAYLMAAFGARRLDELADDDDLAQAFRVIARLLGQAAPRSGFPLAPGTVVDGEVFWIRGKVSLGV